MNRRRERHTFFFVMLGLIVYWQGYVRRREVMETKTIWVIGREKSRTSYSRGNDPWCKLLLFNL